MQARRVGARLFLAVFFVALLAGCPSDTPTSAQVELVGTLTLAREGDEISLGEIWREAGTAELSVKAELSQLKDGALVVGSGTGEAKLRTQQGRLHREGQVEHTLHRQRLPGHGSHLSAGAADRRHMDGRQRVHQMPKWNTHCRRNPTSPSAWWVSSSTTTPTRPTRP